MWICIAPCRDHTSKALKYATRSQGISQFHLHTPRTSANGMNHTRLCLPSRSWYSFTDPEGMKSWVVTVMATICKKGLQLFWHILRKLDDQLLDTTDAGVTEQEY